MKTQTRTWFISQIKGVILITGISLFLAFGANLLRSDRLPWLEKRRILKAGDRFPFVPLTTGGLLQYRDYIGFPTTKEILTIADIQADLLVIEVLNIFFFPCQTQILTLKKTYDTLYNLLMIFFMIAIGISLARGLNITCGCFTSDPNAEKMTWLMIFRDSLILVPGILSYAILCQIRPSPFYQKKHVRANQGHSDEA